MATGKTQSLYNAILLKVVASSALAAKLGSETASNHVIGRRFRRGAEVANHAQRVLLAPMIYIWPGYSEWRPMTADNCATECTVNMCIVQRNSDTGSNLDGVLEFGDALVKELLLSSDGTGGTSSFLSNIGHSLRAKIETPSEDGNASQSEVRLPITFRCTLHPVV